MRKFASVREAFDWWIRNVYPTLPAEQKKGKFTDAWRDYVHKGSISETRMKEVLMAYGHFEVQTVVIYTP